MIQRFEIPVYLILSKYTYDSSNEYSMLGYSFDKEKAMEILKQKVKEFSEEWHMEASVPEWCSNETTWDVGGMYIFEIEERNIEV